MHRKHDQLKDLVLPSSPTCRIDVDSREIARDDGLEGKTIFVNIASGDEAEHEAEAKQVKARCLVSGRRIRARCGRDRCAWQRTRVGPSCALRAGPRTVPGAEDSR